MKRSAKNDRECCTWRVTDKEIAAVDDLLNKLRAQKTLDEMEEVYNENDLNNEWNRLIGIQKVKNAVVSAVAGYFLDNMCDSIECYVESVWPDIMYNCIYDPMIAKGFTAKQASERDDFREYAYGSMQDNGEYEYISKCAGAVAKVLRRHRKELIEEITKVKLKKK